ncbi:MAG: hypothetical protein PHE25_00950 [Candidatus Gracilibacteria bacterium]|nr:hypothetical protein [Candidatus Gracilibacteria bacterium]
MTSIEKPPKTLDNGPDNGEGGQKKQELALADVKNFKDYGLGINSDIDKNGVNLNIGKIANGVEADLKAQLNGVNDPETREQLEKTIASISQGFRQINPNLQLNNNEMLLLANQYRGVMEAIATEIAENKQGENAADKNQANKKTELAHKSTQEFCDSLLESLKAIAEKGKKGVSMAENTEHAPELNKAEVALEGMPPPSQNPKENQSPTATA